ncbi:tektin bundle-interacting protein 1 [Excalfactoria chinensis]|uniref:tektin bundle-interacting protein 1 n=1 Tax=Excalfactoria chinensis TaxID=46218 RepID=UPI003B3AA6C9
MEPGVHRAVVPQSTLETDFPLPLCSEDYVTLRGPRYAPVLRQAVRWKKSPLGWDAAGQSWWTEPSCRGAEDTGCSFAPGTAWQRWQRWQRLRSTSEVDPLPPVYDQHLREAACWDPTVPAAYPGPGTRWGAFLWQERPVLGKEYVATRSQGSAALGGSAGYVPLLSFCQPRNTRRDVCSWSLLQHQPSAPQ